MAGSMKAYRLQFPYCAHPGCTRLGDHVDHIVPLAELARDDHRRYAWSNYQTLCEPHHQEKTTADAQRGKTRLR